MATQKQKVQMHLIMGKSITPIEALNKYGCFRLADVIFKLRGDGMDIATEKVKGKENHYARYYLRG